MKAANSILFCLSFAAGAPLLAQEATAAALASVTSTQSIYLEYRELGYGIGSWGIPMTLQSAPFQKEPDLGPRKVYRGTLKFGDSPEAFVAFVWDQAEGKLYLDLNRNQDFTDDADGVFASRGGHHTPFQIFGRVHLPFKTPLGTERVALDLLFTGFRGAPTATATAYYCWQGKVTQRGQEWQVAVVDNLFGKIGSAETGSLIIRPWTEGGKAGDLPDVSLYSLPFTREVFFGHQTFHLECSLAQQDNHLKYRLNLTQRALPLGELRITGQYIHRLVLSPAASGGAPVPGVPVTVILESPGPVERVPVGAYQYGLSLKQGGVEARPSMNSLGSYARNSEPLVVGANRAATLTAGGPLTNSVTLARRGRSLAMSYQLLGAKGWAYQLQTARKEPEFTIYRPGKSADKELASGRFQFG